MKKLLVIFAAICAISLSACGGNQNAATNTDDAQTQTTQQATTQQADVQTEAPADTSKGIVDGKYEVEIVSARTATDFEGKPAIVVTYNFTNNSDQNAALLTSVGNNAFQNSVQCAVPVMSPDVMDAQPSTAQVMPGGTITAECAYSLQDTTNPVTIQVGPLININGEINAQKVFEIAQ